MRVYTRYKRPRSRQKKRPSWPYLLLSLLLCGAGLWIASRYVEWGEISKPIGQRARSGQETGTNLQSRLPPPVREGPAGLSEPTNAVTAGGQSFDTNAPVTPIPEPPATPPEELAPVARKTVYAAQLALIGRGISPGCIDGVLGFQTREALRTFQEIERLPVTGQLDAKTQERLLSSPALERKYILLSSDFASLTPVPSTWVGKSQQPFLGYESILEMLAEKSFSSRSWIKAINPGINWSNLSPGIIIKLPAPAFPQVRRKAAFVKIQLGAKTIQAFDAQTNLMAHFPCSIARRVEKRPVGLLFVENIALSPNYRFDPNMFPESPEARRLSQPLMIPPGPNNPVGAAWIGLNLPGYGIHGAPSPEQIGRTESHGCFRLANWNAEYLARLVWVGAPVRVEP